MRAQLPDPERGGTVVLGEAPEPGPAADEALIAVEAYSVNRGETFQLDGQLDRRWEGWRPGKDVAGTVVRAAADGTGPAAGTRVVAHPPAYGWAERVAVPVHSIAGLPDSIDAVTAAALPWRASPRCACSGRRARWRAGGCWSPGRAGASATTSRSWPRRRVRP